MVKRNFVALVVVAFMVSFCGTPPEAGDLQTTESSEQENKITDNKGVVTAVVVGASVVACYYAPGVKTKCPSWVRKAWTSSRNGVTWVGKRVADGGKRVWDGIKKPFRKKPTDTDKVADAANKPPQTKGRKVEAEAEGSGQ